jgi:dihydroorotate dehydrogenase (NAD+) catalytic subunit
MDIDLSISLNRLKLRNPILVASGTFGYAKEFESLVPFEQLGGVVPKTVTAQPRAGNPPPRTVETASGLLNAIGLDNDGIDYFIEHHVPYLKTLNTAIIANVAGKTEDEFLELVAKLEPSRDSLAAIELNLSCPNVSGGIDFATNPEMTRRILDRCRQVSSLPLLAKLTPNITDILPIAKAAIDGGADALSLVNTFVGIAIDWKRKRPILGNVTGGLSGPAIKPLALRVVWQVAKAKIGPIIGIGGIANRDDVMEFLMAGASAVQIGTANFYNPDGAGKLAQQLPEAIRLVGATSVTDVVGLLHR